MLFSRNLFSRVRTSPARKRSARLTLERIEERLLPGEAVGLAYLASLSVFLDAVPAVAAPSEDLTASPLILRPQTARHSEDAGLIALAASPAPLSEGQETYTASTPNSTRAAIFADQAPADSFATRPPRASRTPEGFANPRAGNEFTSAVVLEAYFSSGTLAPRAAEAHPTPVAPEQGVHDGAFAAHPAVGRPVRPPTSPGGSGAAAGPAWSGYARDAQHTALSGFRSNSLTNGIRWQVPVDLHPPGFLGIHYGTPEITQNNTVIVPVKTAQGTGAGWQVEGHRGTDGHLMWTQTTTYSPPPYNWVPSYSGVLTPSGRLYYPGPGGTVYYCDNPDAEGATVTGQFAFYGIDNYNQNPDAYNNNVRISTPLTVDGNGTIYFGFQTGDSPPLGLSSGVARMDMTGAGTWIAAGAAVAGASRPHLNSAPALSNDQSTLYIALRADASDGYLVALNTTTLSPQSAVYLLDPRSDPTNVLPAWITSDSTSSPMVGPDGDVYYGVLEDPFPDHNDRGWLLHFSGDLSQTKTPGSFGWDNTPSLVPASLVPDYTGTSTYLLMCKYNNYADIGTGDGVNKIAVLDPKAAMPDPVLPSVTVMSEVKTIAGVTPDPVLPGVREWCINTAAVDPFTRSILANSEDGTLYRWSMVTNTFTESINLQPPTSEAYTPTVVGPDGTVYAINNAKLFAVG
jgi:hypothetical protein